MNQNQTIKTYQLKKEKVISFKHTTLSLKLLKRVGTKLTFLKRKLMLNKKIIKIGNYSNLLQYSKNKISNIEKGTIVDKEIHSAATSLIKIDYSIINDKIILPDYLTENKQWNGKVLHLRKNGLNRSTVLMQDLKKLELNKMNLLNRHFSVSTLKFSKNDTINLNNDNSLKSVNRNNYKLIEKESLRDIKLFNLLNRITTFNAEEANSQYLLYHFSNKNKYPFKIALHIIKLAFLSMGCLISRPKFSVVSELKSEDIDTYHSKPQSKVIVKLFYFMKKNKDKININRNRSKLDILANYRLNLQFLTDYFANLFNSEIRLELIELKKPHYNSQILAQYLALKSYKYRFVKLIKTLFRGSNIEKPSNILSFCQGPRNSKFNLFPSFLAGIRIRLGGRTFKQKIIPRRTVQLIQKGSLNRANVKYIEKAKFTGKTRRGSYTFTITLGHIF